MPAGACAFKTAFDTVEVCAVDGTSSDPTLLFTNNVVCWAEFDASKELANTTEDSFLTEGKFPNSKETDLADGKSLKRSLEPPRVMGSKQCCEE